MNRRGFSGLALALTASAAGAADDLGPVGDDAGRLSPPGEGKETPPSPPNVPTKTMGGKQFWTDLLVDHGWRIQRNVLSGHCRLLDPADVRRGWGAWPQMQRDFHQVRAQSSLPEYQGKVTIALHGLMRSRRSMDGICRYLNKEGAHDTIAMGYASSRDSIASHAKALASVLQHVRGQPQIHLVGHSLGNLVIRRYYRACELAKTPPDPRIRRAVMLAPPNQGARLAELFRNNQLFRTVWGVSGRQIAEWTELNKQLGTPRCEFGIVAGGLASRNPILPGEDDWVVSVDETKLAGAHDFLVQPISHTWIMDNVETQQCVLRFLERGFFVSAEARRPLREQDID